MSVKFTTLTFAASFRHSGSEMALMFRNVATPRYGAQPRDAGTRKRSQWKKTRAAGKRKK